MRAIKYTLGTLLHLFAVLAMVVSISARADTKISDLTSHPYSSWADGDLFPIVDISSTTTKKTTVLDLANYTRDAITKDASTFYGDPTNGDDATCDGSTARKCKTLTKLLSLCTDPSIGYSLHLAVGNYDGIGTLTWLPNVSVYGAGGSTTINQALTYTAQTGDIASFVFDSIGVNSMTLDLTLATFALPIFNNGGYSITRTDSTPGAHLVRVMGSTVGNIDTAGAIYVSNSLFISSASIRNGGTMACIGCIFGIGMDMYGTASAQFQASTYVGFVTGHTVGSDTPVVKLDASSYVSGSITGATTEYIDDAQYMNNTPAGGIAATTVQAALNELDTEKLSAVPISQQIQVEMGGNDTTCVVGDLAKPCATPGGAEAKILDASDTKLYTVNIGPGKFDVMGIVKKSYVNWSGKGTASTVIWTSDSSTMDLTNPGMDTGIHTYALQDMKFLMATTMNTFAIGGTGELHLVFKDMEFRSNFDAIGRGGEDNINHFGRVDYNDGFTITSFSLTGAAITTEGETKLQADNGNGAQMLMPGSQILGAMTVKSVDGTSFIVAGFIGGFIGGSGLTVDGAAAQAYIDDSAVISGSVTLLNSGTTELVSNARFEKYTPTTSSDWPSVPTTVRDALDDLAALWTAAAFPNGARLTTSGAQPTCDVDHRGLMWNVEGAAGVADQLQVCQKDVLDTYTWVTH